MTSDQPHDRAFEEYLAGNSALSQRYRREATEAPPAKLDAAIVAAAHREVGHRAQWFKLAFLRAWQVPVALAAVAVLAVGITLQLAKREEQSAAPPAASSSGMVNERTQVSPKLADRGKSAQASQPAPAITGGVLTEKADSSGSGEYHALPQADATSPEQASRQAPAQEELESDPAARLRDYIAQREQPAAQPQAAPPAKPRAEPQTQALAGAADEARTPQAAQASQDKPKRKTRPAQPKPGEQASVAEAKTEAAPAERQAAAAPAPEAPSAGPPAAVATAAESPERWLARILVLRRQGSVAEAHVQLARFRQRYPNYPLPPELK